MTGGAGGRATVRWDEAGPEDLLFAGFAGGAGCAGACATAVGVAGALMGRAVTIAGRSLSRGRAAEVADAAKAPAVITPRRTIDVIMSRAMWRIRLWILHRMVELRYAFSHAQVSAV